MANTKKKSTTTVIEQRVKPIPKPSPEIGIDVDDTLFDDIITASQNNNLNTAAIEALSNSAQNREQTYELIDSMAHDGIIAAVLSCVDAGDKVLIWRDAHRCHHNAVKLAGAIPIYYDLNIDENFGVSLPVSVKNWKNICKNITLKQL